jgi:mycothiol system anti-sigma-R factor
MSAEHSKQDCADFLERIVYLLDNELDETECALVRMHLEECSPCLETYDLQRTVKQVVARSCSEKAPDALKQRVRVRIREIQVRIQES